jgi:hypothetical protein
MMLASRDRPTARLFLCALVLTAFFAAGCRESAPGNSNSAPSERFAWENARASDRATVAKAKRACAQHKMVPMPGGTDPFTQCLKQQADAAFGKPAFEEICDAIPGSQVNQSEQKCMTFDL